MQFRDNARLDPSQVEDRRGGGGGGGGLGRGAAIGGGGIGTILIALVLSFVLGINPLETMGYGSPSSAPSGRSSGYGQLPGQEVGPEGSALGQQCQTGADANARDDCRLVGFVNSIQAFWQEEYRRAGGQYRPARTVFFSGATETGCGGATAQVGPFYCPNDEKVYIDLGFYEQLSRQFGASSGPLAQAYVLAHEYGHHVQDIEGILERVNRGESGPNSDPVRLELQADCFAGVWVRQAAATGYLTPPTEKDIADALSAVTAVGDDRIQERVQGRVNPEKWTHGSAEQRVNWFKQGYQSGSSDGCNTFR